MHAGKVQIGQNVGFMASQGRNDGVSEPQDPPPLHLHPVWISAVVAARDASRSHRFAGGFVAEGGG